uniref:Uncharacterized protein n=1 Tax=Globisporangium ultimum (strain ATCC 200006 / CBS 805.95 / DAOM BR144) TaxID=431595 RepID=K3W7F9_GLOUD
HLRNTIINDDLPAISTPRDEHFDGFGAGTSENRANAEVSHKHSSLLDVYTIPQPRTQEFVESTGRLPGFADLDIHELEEYVRMAHYRARVLIHKHVSVEHLDAEHVKPPWLLALEKTIAMVRDLGVQSTSPKIMATPIASTGGNATHLTHIHSRVLFQLAAILKTYKQDYGDTSFTRQLVSLHSKLGMWKYDQTSALLAALDATKETGICEEKQRNLEFYHVHEGRHNLKERYGT